MRIQRIARQRRALLHLIGHRQLTESIAMTLTNTLLVAEPKLPHLRIEIWRSAFRLSPGRSERYSDWPMRMLAREYGASYSLCEVMLDQFLVAMKDRAKNRHYLYNSMEEQPVAVN